MAGIGKFLRQAREKNGYSLDEMVEITKIHHKYLQALEEDRFEQIPSPFYVRVFIRSYARRLHLRYQPLIRLYEASLQKSSSVNSSSKPSSGIRKRLEKANSSQTLPSVQAKPSSLPAIIPKESFPSRKTIFGSKRKTNKTYWMVLTMVLVVMVLIGIKVFILQ